MEEKIEVSAEEAAVNLTEPTGQTEPPVEAAEESSEKKKKGGFGRILGKFLLNPVLPILISGLLRAFAIYIFVTPNEFAPGGTNGIAVLLQKATGWNSGIFLLMISVPLFFLAFFCVGKREAIVSTMSFIVSSGVLMLLPLIHGIEILQYGGGDGIDKIVHGLFGAVAGGIFLGLALAIMLKCCGAAGGTTIIALVINKKFRNLSVSMLTSVFDAVVVFVSFFVFNRGGDFTAKLDPVFLALVSLVVTSKVSDIIVQGFKTAYKFEIVTDNENAAALAEEIMETLHHGVTKISAEGMYLHEGKSMLVCIIRKRQIAALQRIIRKYPETFAYFSSTSEVYGRFAK